MKRFTLLLAMAALPGLAAAAPQVNFQGDVATQTCRITVNGETNAVVVLPTVAVADFGGPGSTVGSTPFTIEGRDCPVSAGEQTFTVRYLGHNVTEEGNLATGNAAGDTAISLLMKPGMVPGVPEHSYRDIKLAPGEASWDFTDEAQYISEGGSPTAGKVTAVVEYVITYY